LFDSNTDKEMKEKVQLYFAQQAQECWLYDQNGKMRFFNQQTEFFYSQLVPSFPGEIEI
jgi:Uma2 family endonuclease